MLDTAITSAQSRARALHNNLYHFWVSALLIWAIWAQVRKRGFYFFLDFLVLVLDLLYFRNIIANETGIFFQNTNHFYFDLNEY